MASHDEHPSAGGHRIVGPAKPSAFSATPTISAPPSLYQPATTAPPSAKAPQASTSYVSATPARPAGRTIVPPSMTLDEGDVNGFKGTAAGKKAVRNNKKRGNNKQNSRRDDPSLSYHPSVVYEVGKPCDYALYKAYVNQQRMQRRKELEEERMRGRDSDGSSYYSEDDIPSDNETQATNKKARLYAPPSSYDDDKPSAGLGSAPSFTPATASTPSFTPATVTPNAAAAVREETGDEAYQRRLAMSRGTAAPSAPPSAPPPQAYPAFSPASTPASAYASAPGSSYTPDSSAPPPAPPSSFRPPLGLSRPTSSDFFSAGSPTPPPPPPGFNPPPGFGPAPSAPSFATYGTSPSFVSSSSAAGAGPAPSASSAVSDAAAKAREIAARLSKLAGMNMPPLPPLSGAATAFVAAGSGPAYPPPPAQAAQPAEPDTRSFAERHMSKLGWTAGKGLGASESGITTALAVSSAPSGQPSKKALAKHKAAGTAPPPPPTGLAGRATVVDASRAERERAQVENYGEPSRIVLLTNMVGPAEVDADLQAEVAEEANRFGVVERVFVHVVPGEYRDDEAVRIFLVMSGLAGGYNAVKQFDGRFFGGRTVRACFYKESDMRSGYYTM